MTRPLSRSPTPRPRLGTSIIAALRATARALEGAAAPGMVIGGIAVIARGVPRLTRDVDVTMLAGDLDAPEIASHFARYGFESRIDDAISFARRHQVLLLRHATSGVDLDLSLAWLPFEVEAVEKADRLKVGGVSIRIARAEDLIVYKAIAWRPQDQQDAERLLALHGLELDLARIRRLIRRFVEAQVFNGRDSRLDRERLM